MKKVLLACAFFSVSLHTAFPVDTEFVIFKAAASIPVVYVEENPVTFVEKQVTKILKAQEIINLSMGRPIDFKPADPKSEMLAVAVAYEEDGQPPGTADPQVAVANPKTRVILWKPLEAALADRWGKTIATIPELEYDRIYTGGPGKISYKGQGIAKVVIPEGDPVGGAADNKFFEVVFHGTGKVGLTAYFPSPGPNGEAVGTFKTVAFSATGLGARVKLSFRDSKMVAAGTPAKLVNGLTVKGMITTTGTPLGTIFRDEGF